MAQKAEKLKIPSGYEIYHSEYNEGDFFVEGLVPKNVVTILCGSSDAGKSHFTRSLALDVVSGKETFLGQKLHTTTKKVLFVSTEDPDARWNKILHQNGLTPDEVEGIKNLDLVFDDFKRSFEQCAQTKYDLVIIDTFGDMFQGDINNSIDVRRFMSMYKGYARKNGAAVIIVHHISKKAEQIGVASKNNLLGSQAIESSARCVLELKLDTSTPGSNIRTLHILKCNMLDGLTKSKPITVVLTDKLRYELIRQKFCTKGQDNDPKMPLEQRVWELNREGNSIRSIVTILKDEGYEKAGRSKIADMIKSQKAE